MTQKETQQLVENIDSLTNAIEGLSYEMSSLKELFQCDITKTNIAEAILMLGTELRSYNENQRKIAHKEMSKYFKLEK